MSIGVPVVIAGTVALLPSLPDRQYDYHGGFRGGACSLVDDAVVVAERIIFRKDQGMRGIEATEGTLDVIRPV